MFYDDALCKFTFDLLTYFLLTRFTTREGSSAFQRGQARSLSQVSRAATSQFLGPPIQASTDYDTQQCIEIKRDNRKFFTGSTTPTALAKFM